MYLVTKKFDESISDFVMSMTRLFVSCLTINILPGTVSERPLRFDMRSSNWLGYEEAHGISKNMVYHPQTERLEFGTVSNLRRSIRRDAVHCLCSSWFTQ